MTVKCLGLLLILVTSEQSNTPSKEVRSSVHHRFFSLIDDIFNELIVWKLNLLAVAVTYWLYNEEQFRLRSDLKIFQTLNGQNIVLWRHFIEFKKKAELHS